MTSIPGRIAALCAALATAAAVSLAAAGPASAVTAPAIGTPEQAGYAAWGAQFRYVQASVTLPDANDFATEVGNLEFSVQLRSRHFVAVLGVSSIAEPGDYRAAVNVFDPTVADRDVYPNGLLCSTAITSASLCPKTPEDWHNNSAKFAPGDTVFLSVSYDRSTHGTTFLVKDPTADVVLSYTLPSVDGISWKRARVGAEFGCSPWASCGGESSPVGYTPPGSPVHLAKFAGIQITTYSGHRTGLRSWWEHAKAYWTGNGTSTGTINAEPHHLLDGGTAFNTYLEP
jgi:hypothetical protein